MDESSDTPKLDTEEISVEYANNVNIETTIWDIKAVFGEFSNRSKSISWHTSITMPLATAKLLAYYLELNIALYEMYNGKVRIPEGGLPQKPFLLPERESNPREKEFLEALHEHWKRFMDGMKD